MFDIVDFTSFLSVNLSLTSRFVLNPDPYVEVIWDFSFQFAMRYPDLHCFVTDDIRMALGCQSSAKKSLAGGQG